MYMHVYGNFVSDISQFKVIKRQMKGGMWRACQNCHHWRQHLMVTISRDEITKPHARVFANYDIISVEMNIVHTKNVHALEKVNPLTQLLTRVSIRDPNVMIVPLNCQLWSPWNIYYDIFDKCLELKYVGTKMIYICFMFIPICLLLLSWALLIFSSWSFVI